MHTPPTLVYREALSFAHFKSAMVDYLVTILFKSPPETLHLQTHRSSPNHPRTRNHHGKCFQTTHDERLFPICRGGRDGFKRNANGEHSVFQSGSGINRYRTERVMFGDELLPKHNRSGSYTPSTAFGNVLLDRLCKNGTHFQVRLVQE
mmetsp:Transcript_35119/g.35331  ORF Transcript_35119/g.35331 Transcript_35119/m.35331 type:complete len:149 (-) Transcript_35119:91-537(-)